MKYGPFVCIGVVLAILFVLWAFWGGRNYEFVGLAPLSPDTCGSYTGSLYNWGNITPAIGYDPIEGNTCVPADVACTSELSVQTPQQAVIIDNTPLLASEFLPPTTPSAPSPPAIIPSVPIIPVQTRSQIIIPVQPKPRRSFISRGERLCCQTMERIYGVPFTSIRPDWLSNPETGMKLELDCYNDELKIAVEYNGEQHYKWPNFTNQTHKQFIDQIRRDNLKVERCDSNGIYLIVVPYNVPYDNIPAFIMSHLPETIRKRLQEEHILE